VTARANWRIMFRFEGPDSVDVELIDYYLRFMKTPCPRKLQHIPDIDHLAFQGDASERRAGLPGRGLRRGAH
jgi:hypothetical protein